MTNGHLLELLWLKAIQAEVHFTNLKAQEDVPEQELRKARLEAEEAYLAMATAENLGV